MNYPEYNNVVSRLRFPKLSIAAAFAGHDVFLPADCVFDGIGLPPMPGNKPVFEPIAESPERPPIPTRHGESARRSDTSRPEFFFLRS